MNRGLQSSVKVRAGKYIALWGQKAGAVNQEWGVKDDFQTRSDHT